MPQTVESRTKMLNIPLGIIGNNSNACLEYLSKFWSIFIREFWKKALASRDIPQNIQDSSETLFLR